VLYRKAERGRFKDFRPKCQPFYTLHFKTVVTEIQNTFVCGKMYDILLGKVSHHIKYMGDK
jgi:hypothetical protein